MNNYKDITVQYHPKKRPNGCVYEHVLVMEKILGRYLLDGEVVHHNDENKSNNKPSNLIVFQTQADHARYHSSTYKELIQNDNGSYACIKNTYICKHCGIEYEGEKGSSYCSNICAADIRKSATRPSKEKLKELLIASSFRAVGKLYDVSDNAIRKWCKAYDMSTSSKDYK